MRDYPRAVKPSGLAIEYLPSACLTSCVAEEELHLDLQVWMIMFSRSMEKVPGLSVCPSVFPVVAEPFNVGLASHSALLRDRFLALLGT
jgi:hypothetical protein